MVWVLQMSVRNAPTVEVFVPEYTSQTPNGFCLPAIIPGTTLQATEISAYEGPFLEDDYGQEVVDIAALHIYNSGELEVLNTGITIQMENTDYVFYGGHIPPGATVVLLEINAAVYQKGTVKACAGWQETTDQKQVEGLQISDKDNGTLVVTNTTDKTLYNLRLYYKCWLSPPDIFMGGQTYSVTIPQLAPGQTQMLCPDRYATGYSKVVSVVSDP